MPGPTLINEFYIIFYCYIEINHSGIKPKSYNILFSDIKLTLKRNQKSEYLMKILIRIRSIRIENQKPQ